MTPDGEGELRRRRVSEKPPAGFKSTLAEVQAKATNVGEFVVFVIIATLSCAMVYELTKGFFMHPDLVEVYPGYGGYVSVTDYAKDKQVAMVLYERGASGHA